MTEISRELVERCVALVRDVAERGLLDAAAALGQIARAQTIVAELPKPVDPDLIEARELFIEMEGGVDAHRNVVIDIRKGAADCSEEIQLLLKGIKRGRSLARTQEAGQSPRSEEGAR